MWILHSEGDFLQGKTVWLRPGKTYLFGRIKKDGVRHAIQHTSISRKHLIIEVSPVKSGDGSHVYAKSQLIVTDQDTKYGTIIDGEKVKGQRKILDNSGHTLGLGNYQHALKIDWRPTVLSFSFSSKELKAKDPLAPIRARLEDLDIKTIIQYIVGTTTHVVQNKRNTAKGLQALINGKPIVQDSYIDALVYAATPSNLEDLESLSPLEEDFNAAWPDPALHIPPPGKEPIQRDAAAFAPKLDRLYIFEGYTFVFCDEIQFSNLQPPINNGHGKALLFPIENGKTTASEIVQFMRNGGGQKGLEGDRDSPDRVVLVRFRAKGGYEEWSIELGNQVALMMDLRVIEQSEFLDAILSSDASPLHRPLPREVTLASLDAVSAQNSISTPESYEQLPQQGAAAAAPAPSKPTKRPQINDFVSKVKAFDDGFDMASIPAYSPGADEEPRNDSQSMDVDDAREQAEQASLRAESDEETMASLLPGAKAMKRRRAEQSVNQDEPGPKPPHEAPPKPKRQKVDVLEVARQHREAEDLAARQRRHEQDSLQSVIQDMTVAQMKNLAVVEEMDVSLRRTSSSHTEDGSQWDDRWNGRKNFKKFRRRGDMDAPRHRVQAVILPLMEVKRKDFGIGDHYWTNRGNSPDHDLGDRPRDREPSQPEVQMLVSQPSDQGGTPPAPSIRNHKRTREARHSDSDEELKFRFRRRR